jgi:hypothetical protein
VSIDKAREIADLIIAQRERSARRRKPTVADALARANEIRAQQTENIALAA